MLQRAPASSADFGSDLSHPLELSKTLLHRVTVKPLPLSTIDITRGESAGKSVSLVTYGIGWLRIRKRQNLPLVGFKKRCPLQRAIQLSHSDFARCLVFCQGKKKGDDAYGTFHFTR